MNEFGIRLGFQNIRQSFRQTGLRAKDLQRAIGYKEETRENELSELIKDTMNNLNTSNQWTKAQLAEKIKQFGEYLYRMKQKFVMLQVIYTKLTGQPFNDQFDLMDVILHQNDNRKYIIFGGSREIYDTYVHDLQLLPQLIPGGKITFSQKICYYAELLQINEHEILNKIFGLPGQPAPVRIRDCADVFPQQKFINQAYHEVHQTHPTETIARVKRNMDDLLDKETRAAKRLKITHI